MSNTNIAITLISLCIAPFATQQDENASGGTEKKTERQAFEKKLRYLNPALKGGDFGKWHAEYLKALENNDAWKEIVRAAKDSDTRTTRAGEVLAFSGKYRVSPVRLRNMKFPMKSDGHFSVFLFHPTEQLINGKWVPVPEAIRKRRYLLVRGQAPKPHDPYCVVACCYLGNLSEQDIMDLVKESCRF